MIKTATVVFCLIAFAAMPATAQKKIKIKNKDNAQTTLTVDSLKKSAGPKMSIKDKVKSSNKKDGLFILYQDTATGSVQMYIKKDQLEKDFIYQSFSMGGPTSMYLNQNMIRSTMVFQMKKKFDKLEFGQMNTEFWYDPANPVSKSANVDVTQAIFYSAKIDAEDSTGYLVAADGLFLSDKLDPIKPMVAPGPLSSMMFNLGNLSTAKSGYKNIRSYPDNTDVVVELAFDNPAPFNSGGKDITDARYNRIVFQHSFLEMPKNNFKPRYDDPRIGYFTKEVENMTTINKAQDFKDMINRWHLVKKNPSAAISEPVEPIVWWVENTTPLEYRQTIVEAGLKWNEAFEKAGFKNAVEMRIMPDTATWDPADIRYNVIRWVSSPYPTYGAIGPSFVNPRTGQILGADITVEWLSGSSSPALAELFDEKAINTDLPSILLAGKEEPVVEAKHMHSACTLAGEIKAQYSAGLTVLESADAPPEEIKELHKQFLYYLIMHEMGHTMGLNHNMKASQMLSPKEVNDVNITRKKGMIGSVMDYPAINIALDRAKQGDYYTTLAGPYDLWAIEYGYKPFSDQEEAEGLKKILSQSTKPELSFGNDADDMRRPGSGIDPRVNVNDLSNDMVAYATDRLKLVDNLMSKIKAKYSKDGRSYAELRSRYGTLLSQRRDMLQAVSRYIGGVYVDRSFVGQETTNKPFTPVDEAYQKKAMKLIADHAFAPDAFKHDAQLFPYLQAQRRGFGFFGGTEDFKPQTMLLSLQTGVLASMLNPVAMARMSNSSLYGNKYSSAEMMRDVTTAIFAEDLKTNVNLYRLNLQSEFVKGLASIMELGAASYDNASRGAIVFALQRIKTMLATAVSPSEQTRAHRANLKFMIDKALSVDR